ncbi:hypothetical protein [Spiroplasma alleghenense]|uniref:Uncharacterized protein n=1 Tax=Spiroplasma alleghenense TaxID=216931 RepID=A0A345Z552_9MOLU|nr:hypothetical protein [Spiroplasma alleghenense]AXK51731.1 hypothetical protein SALLE_v1c10610 [Spiroplasma alleghenense]
MSITKSIIILIRKDDIKTSFVISESSSSPAEVSKFVNVTNFSESDKKRYNKEMHKSLKGYEIPMSKCSVEIEQALLKIMKQHKEEREQDLREIQKLKQILIKNGLLNNAEENNDINF